MRPDQEEALRLMQEQVIDRAIAENEKAHGLGLETKTDRGDRGWLTGMAAKSVGLAVKVEQFFQLRSQRAPMDPDADDAATEQMVKRASAEVERIMAAAKAGPPEKPKRGRKAPA
jgi:hypothetical protein